MRTIKKIAVVLAGLVAALFTAFQIGRMKQDSENKIDTLTNQGEGMKRALNTDVNTDHNDAVGRLRRNGHLRD